MKRNRIIIEICVVIVFGVLIYFLLPPKIPVITYHDFTRGSVEDNMQISEEVFRKQMKFLKKHHYKSLTLKEMECFLEKKCRLPKRSVLITMDDGWKNELEIAAPILKEYNLHAVIFYVGSNIQGDSPNFMNQEDLERLKKDYPNIELASHTYQLHQEDAYLKSTIELQEDMKKEKEIISNPYFAYPYGKNSKNYLKALEKEGYHLAFTFGPEKEHRKCKRSDSPYLIPRLNFSTDVPMWKFILRLIWFR